MLFDTETRRQVNMDPPELDPDDIIVLDHAQIWIRFDRESGRPVETRIVETLEAEDAISDEWANEPHNFYSILTRDEMIEIIPDSPTAA